MIKWGHSIISRSEGWLVAHLPSSGTYVYAVVSENSGSEGHFSWLSNKEHITVLQSLGKELPPILSKEERAENKGLDHR